MEVSKDAWRIVRALDRAARLQRRAAAADPFGPVALGLLNLALLAPIRPSAAASQLDVPAQSITRAVTDLVSAQLVRRDGDDADGRSYEIALTEKGRATVIRLRDELAARFATFLDGWSEQEITTFADQLDHVVDGIAGDVGTPQRTPGRNPWRSA